MRRAPPRAPRQRKKTAAQQPAWEGRGAVLCAVEVAPPARTVPPSGLRLCACVASRQARWTSRRCRRRCRRRAMSASRAWVRAAASSSGSSVSSPPRVPTPRRADTRGRARTAARLAARLTLCARARAEYKTVCAVSGPLVVMDKVKASGRRTAPLPPHAAPRGRTAHAAPRARHVARAAAARGASPASRRSPGLTPCGAFAARAERHLLRDRQHHAGRRHAAPRPGAGGGRRPRSRAGTRLHRCTDSLGLRLCLSSALAARAGRLRRARQRRTAPTASSCRDAAAPARGCARRRQQAHVRGACGSRAPPRRCAAGVRGHLRHRHALHRAAVHGRGARRGARARSPAPVRARKSAAR
jgi:hypothetical protein